MNNITPSKPISSTTIAAVDSSNPLTLVGNSKEMLLYGGIAVAVIFALSIFLLTVNHYQKTQIESLTKLIKMNLLKKAWGGSPPKLRLMTQRLSRLPRPG